MADNADHLAWANLEFNTVDYFGRFFVTESDAVE
jgi:hypothetical protein